jgi:hypothetical protein
LDLTPDNVRLKMELKLCKDDVPITGRLLSLEGRPLEGVTIEVIWVGQPRERGTSEWVNHFVTMHRKGYWINEGGLRIVRPGTVGVTPSVKTDKQGRFRLTGVGRNRVVTIMLRSERTVAVRLQVASRGGPQAGWVKGDHGLYPAGFTFLLAPTKPIVGTVRDRKTGKPVAGVLVAHSNYHARATTNEKGEYRIIGAPKQPTYMMAVGGGKGVPYLDYTRFDIRDTPGLEPLRVDFDLERGVEISGKVLDRLTGKPVRGSVSYFLPRDNPNAKDYITLSGLKFIISKWGEIGPDGSFSVLGIPGPAVLVVRARDSSAYVRIDARAELERRKVNSFPIGATHAAVPIDVSEKDPKSLTYTIHLTPAGTRPGVILGPDGKPYTGAQPEEPGSCSGHLAGRGRRHEHPRLRARAARPGLRGAGRHPRLPRLGAARHRGPCAVRGHGRALPAHRRGAAPGVDGHRLPPDGRGPLCFPGGQPFPDVPGLRGDQRPAAEREPGRSADLTVRRAMKRLLALLVLALPGLLVAADPEPGAKANALTAKEMREGWLLLFDSETTAGWKTEGEAARVEKGRLVFGGKKPTKVDLSTWFAHYKIEVLLDTVGKGAVDMRVGHQGGIALINSTNAFIAGRNPKDARSHSPVHFDIPADTQVKLHYARLLPIEQERLFNGKDLAGWKVFEGKGKKSRFTVTKEGWLNVKDGPGDLQTTKLFDDFVLQLECISNGKHLNSGIFFRSIPGEYQNGYEAQIQNDFTLKPPRKYAVEQYDPKTHKLIGKKAVESAARDYGTGAIYRRVPARKAAAKDGEWFTMTVVTHGRHLATWVNGVQQVDWTDNRPADKNPRKGYRAEAGAISIQGHDPTTDLSFRDIRIAARPRGK